ncbi:UNVERIFIED_CONTAM: hypothetical protein Slati_4464300 [Sesamum latifolium]|uniref:Uncharacterized protein n=1 Tax=Sesamum latifolium TaxID=2727402 RepID=A0AAW2STJ7_9LAMI
MFGKLLRNHNAEGRGGGTPPPRSPRGTPSSSESKEKRSASLSPGITPRGSSKKSRMSSLSTPPSSSVRSPPHPILKDEKGVPLKYFRA